MIRKLLSQCLIAVLMATSLANPVFADTSLKVTANCLFKKSFFERTTDDLKVSVPPKGTPSNRLVINFTYPENYPKNRFVDLTALKIHDPFKLLENSSPVEITVTDTGFLFVTKNSNNETYSMILDYSNKHDEFIISSLSRTSSSKDYDVNSHVYFGFCQAVEDSNSAVFDDLISKDKAGQTQ